MQGVAHVYAECTQTEIVCIQLLASKIRCGCIGVFALPNGGEVSLHSGLFACFHMFTFVNHQCSSIFTRGRHQLFVVKEYFCSAVDKGVKYGTVLCR
jgi:hypothetical protein